MTEKPKDRDGDSPKVIINIPVAVPERDKLTQALRAAAEEPEVDNVPLEETLIIGKLAESPVQVSEAGEDIMAYTTLEQAHIVKREGNTFVLATDCIYEVSPRIVSEDAVSLTPLSFAVLRTVGEKRGLTNQALKSLKQTPEWEAEVSRLIIEGVLVWDNASKGYQLNEKITTIACEHVTEDQVHVETIPRKIPVPISTVAHLGEMLETEEEKKAKTWSAENKGASETDSAIELLKERDLIITSAASEALNPRHTFRAIINGKVYTLGSTSMKTLGRVVQRTGFNFSETGETFQGLTENTSAVLRQKQLLATGTYTRDGEQKDGMVINPDIDIYAEENARVEDKFIADPDDPDQNVNSFDYTSLTNLALLQKTLEIAEKLRRNAIHIDDKDLDKLTIKNPGEENHIFLDKCTHQCYLLTEEGRLISIYFNLKGNKIDLHIATYVEEATRSDGFIDDEE